MTPYIPDLREPNIEYNFRYFKCLLFATLFSFFMSSCDEDGQALSNLWIDFEISQLESSEAVFLIILFF